MTEALTPTRQALTGTVTGPLVAAIEHAWAAIQVRHPDVPDVVLTLGNGSTRPGQLTLGHFHAGKWAMRDRSAEASTRLPELFVGGEGLAAGPRELLGTLLHEAAHGVAAACEIQDTSRQGRYHNTRYRTVAVELGLGVERDPRIGWSLTAVPDSTAALYSEHIAQLGEAMRAHRLADPHGTGRGTSNNGLVATCECDPPRKIRLSRTAYDTGAISCGVCETDFTNTDSNATSMTREGHAAMTAYQHIPTDSHDTAFDLDEQLAQVAELERAGVDAEQIKQVLRPLAERHAQATNALHLRVRDHVEIAREALDGYRHDRRDYISPGAARQRAVILAGALAAGVENESYGPNASEHAVMSWQIASDRIDTAPGSVRRVLIGTVAAQQAIDKLRGTHTLTAGEAIDLYEENRTRHGHDDDQAETAAISEIEEAVDTTYELAFDDLDLSVIERAERVESMELDADIAERLIEIRRHEHHELAELVAGAILDGHTDPTAAAGQRAEQIRQEHERDRAGEDLLTSHPVRGSDIDRERGPAREALIRFAAAQQAVRELRDSHGDTIEHTVAEHERVRADEPDVEAPWRRAHQHASAAVDAQIENVEHRIRQATADRDAAARLEPDPDELAALLDGAEQRRATARNQVDDIDRLRDMLLDDRKGRARRTADNPTAYQHVAVLNSQAVHPTGREDDRDPASEAVGEGRGENPVQRARAAVERLADHQRQVDQERREDHARNEQLNRWHHDDRTRDDPASTRVGVRAIYGWGMER